MGQETTSINQRIRLPGGPTVDNDNETILAVIVIVLFVLGIFRVVGDMQELYRQTELKGQELSRWSKQ